MARSEHLSLGDVVAATTTWPVLLPVVLGCLASWYSGHLVAHLTVRGLAIGMDMTSQAGHRRYYRVGKEYRRGFHW